MTSVGSHWRQPLFLSLFFLPCSRHSCCRWLLLCNRQPCFNLCILFLTFHLWRVPNVPRLESGSFVLLSLLIFSEISLLGYLRGKNILCVWSDVQDKVLIYFFRKFFHVYPRAKGAIHFFWKASKSLSNQRLPLMSQRSRKMLLAE